MTDEQLKPFVDKKIKSVIEVSEKGRRQFKRGTLRIADNGNYLIIQDTYVRSDYLTSYKAEQFVKVKIQLVR